MNVHEYDSGFGHRKKEINKRQRSERNEIVKPKKGRKCISTSLQIQEGYFIIMNFTTV